MPYANQKHPKQPTKQPTKRQAQHKTNNTATAATTAANKTPTRADIYQRVTDQIIAALEAGADRWKMPWHTTGIENATRPINAISKKPYRGVNTLALWIAASEQGYTSNEWATYKQWQEKGAQVRKGEKSSTVVFWKINDKGEADETSEGNSGNSSDEAEESNRRILARGYFVFNASQVDGYTAPALPQPEPTTFQGNERNAEIDAFFSATGASVQHGGNRAFYRPSSDHIQMPHFEAFFEPVDYYSTLGHETVHWTSAQTRLDRDLTGRFGSEAYAAEELVAELGAAFLCADLGLTNTPRPDHAAYVANWLKVLKDDNRAIFTAASKAQQAADYLHGLQVQPEPEAELERALPAPTPAP